MIARMITLILMWTTFAVGSSVATEPQHNSLSVGEVSSPPRSLSAIRIDVCAALRAEALTRRLGQNPLEVVRLIDLYREIAAHPKRDNSLLLKQLGFKLRSRLEKVRDQIQRTSSLPDRHSLKKETLPTRTIPKTHVLAQQVAAPGGAAIAPGAQPAITPLAAAGTMDYGPDLVDLIQETISPATWNINGGNSSIRYFAPLRVIVVSAPGIVHDQIGDVLGQLRAVP